MRTMPRSMTIESLAGEAGGRSIQDWWKGLESGFCLMRRAAILARLARFRLEMRDGHAGGADFCGQDLQDFDQ